MNLLISFSQIIKLNGSSARVRQKHHSVLCMFSFVCSFSSSAPIVLLSMQSLNLQLVRGLPV